MFKKHSFQVKMIKDGDDTDPALPIDFEAAAENMLEATKLIGPEVAKVAVAIMVVNAGCKILVNRLSK